MSFPWYLQVPLADSYKQAENPIIIYIVNGIYKVTSAYSIVFPDQIYDNTGKLCQYFIEIVLFNLLLINDVVLMRHNCGIELNRT